MPAVKLQTKSKLLNDLIERITTEVSKGQTVHLREGDKFGLAIYSDRLLLADSNHIIDAWNEFDEEKKAGEKVLLAATNAILRKIVPEGTHDYLTIIGRCCSDYEVQNSINLELLCDPEKLFSMTDSQRTNIYAPECINCKRKVIPTSSFFRYEPVDKSRIVEVISRVKSISDKLTDRLLGMDVEISNDAIPTEIAVLQDAYGIRIVTKNKELCYQTLEDVKGIMAPIQVKDYIANPKRNRYMSIHLIGTYGNSSENAIIEVQIRDEKMRDYCEDPVSPAYYNLRDKRKTEVRSKNPKWVHLNKVLKTVLEPNHFSFQK